MIVCSCNVLSDHDVRSACSGAQAPRTPGQVYGCLGCSPQCGRCARTIKAIMDEALGACGKQCCPGCPHTAAAEIESQVPFIGPAHVHAHPHSHVAHADHAVGAAA
ncbi:MAG: bacterioferritin [Tardiphaga sp.]|nr:bacterioferritin [Tardiphaga sp.]